MSDAGGSKPRETLRLLTWRAALAAGPIVPDAQDLTDWAALLEEAAATNEAQLLRDCASVLRGFSPDLGAGWMPAPDAGTSDARWTTVAAARELADLASTFRGSAAPTLRRPIVPTYSGYPDNPAGIGPGADDPDLSTDVRAISRTLSAELGGPGDSYDAGSLRTALDLLVELYRRLPAFDYRMYRAAPIDVLCNAIAQATLVHFALAARDLWTRPLGSLAFFRASARLGNASLGPYFSNVPSVVRHSRDIYDLAQYAAASAKQAGDEDACGAWIALLSRGCSGSALAEIVHDLGDYSAARTLGAILARVISPPAASVDRDMLRQIRDSGIDMRDYALAASAQRALAVSHPDLAHEWLILGDIYATGGNFAAAEGVYRRLLETDRDLAVLSRLEMVRRDVFEHHNVEVGYHSPSDRMPSRLHRRGEVANHTRRKGHVIAAVNVN